MQEKKNLPYDQPHAIRSSVDGQEEIWQENDSSLLTFSQAAMVP